MSSSRVNDKAVPCSTFFYGVNCAGIAAYVPIGAFTGYDDAQVVQILRKLDSFVVGARDERMIAGNLESFNHLLGCNLIYRIQHENMAAPDIQFLVYRYNTGFPGAVDQLSLVKGDMLRASDVACYDDSDELNLGRMVENASIRALQETAYIDTSVITYRERVGVVCDKASELQRRVGVVSINEVPKNTTFTVQDGSPVVSVEWMRCGQMRRVDAGIESVTGNAQFDHWSKLIIDDIPRLALKIIDGWDARKHTGDLGEGVILQREPEPEPK